MSSSSEPSSSRISSSVQLLQLQKRHISVDLRPFVRHVQVGSLHDLAQEQEGNSRIMAGAGSPLIYLMDKLPSSSTHPCPTNKGA